MLSKLHYLNLYLCSKKYYKIDLLHLIVVTQLSGSCLTTPPKQDRRAMPMSSLSILFISGFIPFLFVYIWSRNHPFLTFFLKKFLESKESLGQILGDALRGLRAEAEGCRDVQLGPRPGSDPRLSGSSVFEKSLQPP